MYYHKLIHEIKTKVNFFFVYELVIIHVVVIVRTWNGQF